jgi:predicted O-linked N-acetylglucosamine transferase (SPINDLY family)
LEIDPGISGIYHNLGVLYHDNGQLDNAEKYYRKALNLDPKSASTYFSLGNLLKINNKYKEAEESYLKSLLLNPNNAQVYFNLALIYSELNELYKAEEYYIKAINLNGNFTSAYYNLGQLYQESLHLDKAKYCYEQAIKTDTNYTQAYRNLGNILGDIGQFDQAEKYYAKALQTDPTKHDIYSNKLFKSNYNPDLSDEQLFNYYKEYENKFTKHLYKDDIKHNNSKILNRKLKIGYVSPDFRQHAVRNFLEPLLSNHNKKDFLVYLYSNSEKEDDITKNYKQYADQWLCIKDINDEDLSEKIKDDEIDILVDLAGHTKNNRLMLFAGKPAPVSMTWLGFGYTTGISAIDYFLTDNIHVPKKYDHLFAETPYRIKNPAFVYRPNKDMGDVSPLPYLSNGYITFGTLTRSIRINHKTIRAWSQVLKSVPNSKLIINSQNYKNQKAKDDLINKFQAYGIEKDRLDIGFDTPPWDILRKMDIGIDCFPHNSGTTLFETLYMGIPFITLEDKPALGRLGSSILHGLNKKEWIAKTESEYIEKLIKLASNVKELEHIRKNLREQMHQSPLMDEPGFTKRIENMYKDMFKKWIKQQ